MTKEWKYTVEPIARFTYKWTVQSRTIDGEEIGPWFGRVRGEDTTFRGAKRAAKKYIAYRKGPVLTRRQKRKLEYLTIEEIC